VNFARVEAIANAVLYEGYMLYPYRPSALKNRFRWMFGVLHPRLAPGASRSGTPSSMQSECLLVGALAGEIEVKLRFLRPTAPESGPGQDASLCEVDVGPTPIAELAAHTVHVPFRCGPDPPVEGAIEFDAVAVGADVYRLTVRVLNLIPVESGEPSRSDGLLAQSMVSTQLVLSVTGSEFVPLRDPPGPLRGAAEACQNSGLWPILVGEPGALDLVFCSPIILDDYPKIAPESPGDLFDGTEIDELLTLRILTLTSEEKRQMAAAGEHTAVLLQRTEALESDRFARLHGTLRSHHLGDRAMKRGDRVRLRPHGRADIFDLALTGLIATIESVEQDYDGRSYIAVIVDNDPGRDLGALGQPGHRFFFAPEEVELLVPQQNVE
jgi:hypothetical protein